MYALVLVVLLFYIRSKVKHIQVFNNHKNPLFSVSKHMKTVKQVQCVRSLGQISNKHHNAHNCGIINTFLFLMLQRAQLTDFDRFKLMKAKQTVGGHFTLHWHVIVYRYYFSYNNVKKFFFRLCITNTVFTFITFNNCKMINNSFIMKFSLKINRNIDYWKKCVLE